MRLQIIVVLSLSLVSSTTNIFAQARAAKLLPPRTNITIAFTKAYNRAETAKLYSGYLSSVKKCANVNFVSRSGVVIDADFLSIDLLDENDTLEGLKKGMLGLAQVNAGGVPVAVETATAIPFAIRGDSKSREVGSYKLYLIVPASSPYRKPSDLKGKKIAHTTVGSNSGNLAPRAYFPTLGLTPDKDYEVVYSKGHERSIVGLASNFWDAAAVASDQFERMATKGEIQASAFRVLWQSKPFAVSAFVFSASVPKPIQKQIRKCTYQYRFGPEQVKLLDGSDALLPVDYERDYAAVKFVLAHAKQTKK